MHKIDAHHNVEVENGIPKWYGTYPLDTVCMSYGWMKLLKTNVHPYIAHTYKVQTTSVLPFWSTHGGLYNVL